ncbi:MAG: HAMP domain-containing sensor histidine kinase, partial [Pseudomonadota bacterium]
MAENTDDKNPRETQASANDRQQPGTTNPDVKPSDNGRAVDTEAAATPPTTFIGKITEAATALSKPLFQSSFGLPAKLLLLTITFVMLAEILIFLPSVANFRNNWLQDQVTAARLASLAADVDPEGGIPPPLQRELLDTAMVKSVAVSRGGVRRLILPPVEPVAISQSYDLRPKSEITLDRQFLTRLAMIGEALTVFFGPPTRTIQIIGPLKSGPNDFIEVAVSEQPLYEAMLRYGINILVLSIIISLITATLVFVALSSLLVRPMMRIATNMVRFSENPEDASRVIQPSNRNDEIGTTERELAAMQNQLVGLIRQKNRLAQLGLAVSKINHDLRNMLASAQLLSDRLSTVPDATAQRVTPKLVASLDRAIAFCNDTLQFGRAKEAAPRRQKLQLAKIVNEVGDELGLLSEPFDPTSDASQLSGPTINFDVDIPDDLTVDADPDHLYRVLANMCRNASQVLQAT